jgi:hypothetical protein
VESQERVVKMVELVALVVVMEERVIQVERGVKVVIWEEVGDMVVGVGLASVAVVL